MAAPLPHPDLHGPAATPAPLDGPVHHPDSAEAEKSADSAPATPRVRSILPLATARPSATTPP